MTSEGRSDPMEDAAARIRAAADQWGAAIGDAVKLAFRRGLAAQIREEFGPGPWLLHSDGRIESVEQYQPPKDE